MPLLIHQPFSANHPDRDLLINNRTEAMIKATKANLSISNDSENIVQVWPTSSERSQSSDDDEKEQQAALSESEAGQIKAESAFTSKSVTDRTFREYRHRRHLSYDDHQIWSKETESKNATTSGTKRKRQDLNGSTDGKEDKSLSNSRVWPQDHEKGRIGQMEEANSTDSNTSSGSSAHVYNTPVSSTSTEQTRGISRKSDGLSSGADSVTTFEDCKSPSPAGKDAEKGNMLSKNTIAHSADLNSTKSQDETLYQDQRKKNDGDAKIALGGEIQNEKRENDVTDSFPQMLVRAAQRSNTTVFNTAPQRKSCDRCFRMKTKCSRAQPGASTSGPCDGCIRRGFPHDCITSRPDFPHPRITLAKRPRLAASSINPQSGAMQPLVNNHAQENGTRVYYNNERVGNRQIDQVYPEMYRYRTQTASTPQKDLQPLQNSIIRREAWVKDQRNHPLPPLSNNLSCREGSSIYRQRLYHNYGDVHNDQARLSSLQQERTAAVASSLANGQGNLTELTSEELHEISTMVTGELLRRVQVKK
ncbi:uncharacterized protein FA14DRAFT_175630 [Meira miltonrushii]|uniref:Zn(2)-C6 fungal-type domain-containing protein n=1 Tax=Meira miltonrushii TaxID=1280837 RepID=A0A316V195_9BASI|nr:uncharacterized protein FA14DRAFT_175630 [Meira miltonrushii]PWN31326.1 hypothetical protein FA14DRAFT_175630 [Meira miltonrushii]